MKRQVLVAAVVLGAFGAGVACAQPKKLEPGLAWFGELTDLQNSGPQSKGRAALMLEGAPKDRARIRQIMRFSELAGCEAQCERNLRAIEIWQRQEIIDLLKARK